MRIYQLLRLSLTLTIISSPVISAAINPKNAIGIWLFEGHAKDISGKKNHGELMNGAGFTDKAKFNNKALSLDGKDDHVVVKSSKSLDEPVQNYTGVAWIKIKKKTKAVLGGCCNDDHVIISYAGFTNLINVFGPGRGGGHGKVEIGSGQIAPAWNASPELVNDDKWHHLAFTYNGKKKILYIDGKVSIDVAAAGSFGLVGKDLWIGAQSPNRRPTSGLMDDVGVFNVALKEKDIKEIFSKGLGKALGLMPVDPIGRLTTTWVGIKSN